jgi:hypothetical protein
VNIKQNGLVHRYHRLEPEERLRATLEAAARGDEEEYDRLWDTCPMRQYSMTDAAFTDRWRAASTLATAVAIDLAPRLANLRMLAAVRETLPHAIALGVDHGLPDPGELGPEDVERIIEKTPAARSTGPRSTSASKRRPCTRRSAASAARSCASSRRSAEQLDAQT